MNEQMFESSPGSLALFVENRVQCEAVMAGASAANDELVTPLCRRASKTVARLNRLTRHDPDRLRRVPNAHHMRFARSAQHANARRYLCTFIPFNRPKVASIWCVFRSLRLFPTGRARKRACGLLGVIAALLVRRGYSKNRARCAGTGRGSPAKENGRGEPTTSVTPFQPSPSAAKFFINF